MSVLLTEPLAMPRGRGNQPSESRDRIDLRVEPDFHARLKALAERFNVSVSAYIKFAVTERMERDESTGTGSKSKR